MACVFFVGGDRTFKNETAGGVLCVEICGVVAEGRARPTLPATLKGCTLRGKGVCGRATPSVPRCNTRQHAATRRGDGVRGGGSCS